jgi:hypothetical protein
MIKFVSVLRQVGGFLRVLRFPPPIKLTATEILLKVALNTIKQTVIIRAFNDDNKVVLSSSQNVLFKYISRFAASYLDK